MTPVEGLQRPIQELKTGVSNFIKLTFHNHAPIILTLLIVQTRRIEISSPKCTPSLQQQYSSSVETNRRSEPETNPPSIFARAQARAMGTLTKAK